MSIFSKIFGSQTLPRKQPDILFGRFSDGYKDDSKYDSWDKSVAFYEQGDYMNSYRQLLKYLKVNSDENVTFQDEPHRIEFKILQGSKKVVGYADEHKIKAVGKIAKVQKLNIGFLRRLIEGNYDLKYGRYCLDDTGDVAIVFDSHARDASPYKLYYGLKEIALAADKHDDLMVEEFETLAEVNTGHVVQIPDKERQIKADFIDSSIRNVLDEVDNGKLNPGKYPGGITYLLLDTVYKLDYLTRPEGYTMEVLERMHRSFFEVNGLNNVQKNHVLIKEFNVLLQRPKEKILSELYKTVFTFSIINPINHKQFKNIVEGELDNMDWYIEHGHHAVALSVAGYVVGHSLFSFSLPEPDKDLLFLFYQVIEHDYFRELGFTLPYREKNGTINLSSIIREVSSIVESHKSQYPFLHPEYRMLNGDHPTLFAKSYLLMISDLNLSKATEE